MTLQSCVGIWVAVFGFLAASARADSPYSSYMASLVSGCPTFGTSSTNALGLVGRSRQLIEELMNDPNCSGLSTSINSLDLLRDEITRLNAPNSRAAMILEKQSAVESLSFLATTLEGATSPADKATLDLVVQNLATARVDLAVLTAQDPSNSYLKSLKRYGTLPNVVSALDTIGNQLPMMEMCAAKRPNLFADVVGTLLPTVASVGSPAFGVAATSAGKLLTSLARYISLKQYTSRIKELQEIEKSAAIHCAIESIQFARCTADDGIRLIDWITQNPPHAPKSSEWRGYHLLVAEMPGLSKWIQKLETGMEPQTAEDASYNKDNWNIQSFFYITRGEIMGKLGELKREIADAGIRDQRKLGIELLKYAVYRMLAEHTMTPPKINVFTRAILPIDMPTFLVGKTHADFGFNPGTSNSSAESLIMAIEAKVSILPDDLVSVIERNFFRIIDGSTGAEAELKNLLSRRRVADADNLLFEATKPQVSSTPPYLVLHGLRGWLQDFSARTDLLLAAYKGYPDENLRVEQAVNFGDRTRDSVNEIIRQVDDLLTPSNTRVQLIAGHLNVISSSDRYLVDRLSNAVQVQLVGRLRSSRKPSDIEDIVSSSKLELIDKLTRYSPRGETIDAADDLHQARSIHVQHLASFWKFFEKDARKALERESDPRVAALMCARMLAVPSLDKKILKLCAGRELKSDWWKSAPNDWKPKLNLRFDDWAFQPPEKRACAYRDYRRNNYLYEVVRP